MASALTASIPPEEFLLGNLLPIINPHLQLRVVRSHTTGTFVRFLLPLELLLIMMTNFLP